MSAAVEAIVVPATSRPASFTKIIFSFPAVLGSLLVLLGSLTVRDRFNDPDMWWHLRTGQIIAGTHSIPKTDLFSYTTNHHAWTAHEWLSQLLIYAAYRSGGYSGLMLWLCFFTAALLLTGYVLCSMYAGNSKVGFAGGMVIWFFSTAGLAIRPQMVGYVLLVVELTLLELGRRRNPLWFFGLPALFALWVNCHGSFFLGLAVAGIVLISSFFNSRWGWLVPSCWQTRERKLLALALLLSAAALFLNPNGIHQITYPLNTMLHQPVGLSQVEEWKPLQLTAPRGLGLFGVLGSIFLALRVLRQQLFWEELLRLMVGTWFAAAHQRMVFVFGILAAPILCRLLASAWDEYDEKTDRPVPNALMLFASVIVLFLAFPKPGSLSRQVEDGNPVAAVAFINNHHLSGRMLNEYVYGGYLIWAAPDHPVFIDGRGDVFEWTGVLEDFGKWAMVQSDPKALLDKYHVGFCLLAKDSPMSHVLPLLPGWRLIYADDRSVIFSRSST